MERIVNLNIEKLPEGYYLATSENIQGLVAQGRTVAEIIEIAKDVVKKLIEAQKEQISNFSTRRYTLFQIIPEICQKGHCGQF